MKMFDPRNRRKLTAIVVIILVLAMVIPTVIAYLI